MKTRNLITLYKLVLENVTTDLDTGICNDGSLYRG